MHGQKIDLIQQKRTCSAPPRVAPALSLSSSSQGEGECRRGQRRERREGDTRREREREDIVYRYTENGWRRLMMSDNQLEPPTCRGGESEKKRERERDTYI